MIAILAIDRSAHAVTHQTLFERGSLHPVVGFSSRIEWRFRFTIADQFDADEQAAATYITDMSVIGQYRAQTLTHRLAARDYVLQ